MTYLLGFTILYGIPAVLAGVFWLWPVRRLIAMWVGRDVMLGFIPESRHVAHTEKLLGIRTRN